MGCLEIVKREITLENFEKYLSTVRKKSGDHLLGSTIETYTRLTKDLFDSEAVNLNFKELVEYMNKEVKRYQNAVLMSAYRAVLRYLGYDTADCKKVNVEFNFAVASRSKRFLQSKVLSKKELLRLINGLNTVREKLIIYMLFDTACRRAELLNIKMSDIDFKTRTIGIIGKGNLKRDVYYMPSTEKLLLEHIKIQKLTYDSDEPVFVFYDKVGKPVKHQDNALWKWLSSSSEIILGKHVHPHCMRHTCGTLMADDGATILDIKAYLGHADIKTSMIYVEVSSHRRKQAFQKYKSDIETLGDSNE